MSGNQQALLMAGGGTFVPPVLRCVGDPFYLGPNPFTVLSLHGEAVVDSSFTTKTLTNFGVTVSTTQSRFGGGALSFNGSGNYLTAAPVSAFQFGANPFTIEAWVYPTNVSTQDRFIFTLCETLVGGFSFLRFAILGGGGNQRLQAAVQPTTGGAGVSLTSPIANTIPLNQWSSVAFTRSGSNAYLFINGELVATTASWVTYPDAKVSFVGVGAFGNGYTDVNNGRFQGFIDDLRITSGAARYTATYTPLPTVTFCEATTDQFTGQVNGTDFPRGQQVVSSQGTMRVLNPWARLSGQAVTAAPGALNGVLPNRTTPLLGQQIISQQGTTAPPGKSTNLAGAQMSALQGTTARAPYPNLVNSAPPVRAPDSYTEPFAVVSIFPNGTYSVTQQGFEVLSGQWIDTSNQNYVISAIAGQYALNRIIVSNPAFVDAPATPANLGTTQVVNINPPRTEGAIGIGIVIAPTSTNPRYREPGYFCSIDIEAVIQN